MDDTLLIEGMRHAAEECDNGGRSLEASYLREGADRIAALTARTEGATMDDPRLEIVRGGGVMSDRWGSPTLAGNDPGDTTETGMKVTRGRGRTKYGPGVDIDLTGDEVATAIDAFLVAHGVHVRGARTITVNGDLCESGNIYVDPEGFVVANGERFSGDGT